MKSPNIKDLLDTYKRELDFIDFDDDFELMNLFSVRGQLIELYESLNTTQLKSFDSLEIKFIKLSENLKSFNNVIIVQNSKLYEKKILKVA